MQRQPGFTLVEVVIVLAIVGLMTLFVLSGSGVNIKSERFSGEVKQFADYIRRAQIAGATTEAGYGCAGGEQFAPGQESGSKTSCFWRGTGLYVNGANDTLTDFPIFGTDISSYSSDTDPTNNLYGLGAPIDTPLKLSVSKIQSVQTTDPVGGFGVSAIAFLAPTGNAYVCYSPPDANNCIPSSSDLRPFTYTGNITYFLDSLDTNLTAKVTFDPISGTISTKIQ